MPRISPRLIRHARSISPELGLLLRSTRSLEQAQAELRWIKKELPSDQWKQAIERRTNLEPLQYILGSQPFGMLDILCEPGVLIPRWETEEWTMKLIDLLRPLKLPNLSILDACTGTGCILLLLKKELKEANVTAIDLSDKAIGLAEKNSQRCGIDISIFKENVLCPRMPITAGLDLVVSNPPYIPEHDFEKPLLLNGPDLSVKIYEPRMALVGHLEFYRALVEQFVIPYNSKGLVFELGYEEQVAETAKYLPFNWTHGTFHDLAGKLRCVVAWENGSIMEPLKLLLENNE